jgi:hypothetical protein
MEDEVGRAYGTKGGEEERVYAIGRKAIGKETSTRQRYGGWIILRWILQRQDVVLWTALVWLRIGTSGELL